ncbi:MAG: apolipoprotein N-acyltransferase [Nitrospinota bacterium]|nr:apolipoprotein N-acyltransferase [Nitrospinota bacterium]
MVLSILSGVLLSLSFPPFRFSQLSFCFLLPLFFSIQKKTVHQAFRLGFICGVVSYTLSVHWVKNTMISYGGMHPILAYLVMLLLIFYMAIYVGFFAFFFVRFSSKFQPLIFLSVPSIWVSLEFIRAHLFTGFPWILLGYSQYEMRYIVQVADLTGVYGVSFFIVFINFSLFYFFTKPKRLFRWEGLLLVIVSTLVFGYGYLKIGSNIEIDKSRAQNIGIVQPNITPEIKWSRKYIGHIKNVLETQTKSVSRKMKFLEDKDKLIIWPEAALPLVLKDKSISTGWIKKLAVSNKIFLLLGALGDSPNSRGLYNSVFFFNPLGSKSGRYDKKHLVPFGEYVPFQDFLFFVNKLVPVVGQFKSGNKKTIFRIGKNKFATLICYEIIFPREVRKMKGIDFLVNVTNDAWFGKTAASEQHLSMAIFRAIEMRVPLIRVANSGISAVVDETGKVRIRSGLFKKWVWVGQINLKERSETFYSEFGDVFVLCVCFFFVLNLIAYRFSRV